MAKKLLTFELNIFGKRRSNI